MEREEAAKQILEDGNFDINDLKYKKLNPLLKWYNGGKGVTGNKSQKTEQLMEYLNNPDLEPPQFKPWIDVE